MNDIILTLPIRVWSSLFDDFAIYAPGPSNSELHSLLQTTANSALSWATQHGFWFSTSKSYSIFFSRLHQIPPSPISLCNAPLQYHSSGKFLGLTSYSRLTWRDHILSLKTATLHHLQLLQTLSHVTWGADHKSLLYLHVTLILSLLDYGCHIYSLASPSLISLLNPFQHLELCLALGAFQPSPVESLSAESGLPCLSRCHSLLSLCYYRRLHQFSTLKLIFAKVTTNPNLSPLSSPYANSPFFFPYSQPWYSSISLSHLPTLVNPSPFHMHFYSIQP